ncbi:MAG: Stp1/IreP family PP2C-type Ser/Thr phosphatase [Bacilli bacterium]|nr:Stp1/IreP family PP2C-type Ser/Thr phosphatase [Bacilli bacterium]
MKKYLSGNFAFNTHVGRVRLTNEDRSIALTNSKGDVLLLVCDGMGGQSKGDLASTIAVQTLQDEFEKHKGSFLNKLFAKIWLKNAIKKANSAIFDESARNEEYHGMGTTITAVLIVKTFIVIGQAGDSRAYILKDNKLVQISEDQTYVAYLYRTGQIKKEEMATHSKRHVLMNAVGIYPSLNVDITSLNYNNEAILLCSDGLYNNVSHNDIENIMKNTDSVNHKVNQLIQISNANGGSDNIAVVVWEANN